MYPTHQPNAFAPPTSPHLTQSESSAQNQYFAFAILHRVRRISLRTMPLTHVNPHYTYSPPFPATPTYQTQYPLRFGVTLPTEMANHRAIGITFYVAVPCLLRSNMALARLVAIVQLHILSYQLSYNAHSFWSASSSTPYSVPPFSQHSETLRRSSVVRSTSQSSDSEHLLSDKPIIQQPYHPNPPAHRSDWVMWAGNILSDATHDEIYRFFSQAPEDQRFPWE